jgi:hypothetical protein
MDLTGKRLLILAGAGIHSKVVHAAKEMGIYTIVTDYLENSPAKLIADEAWMLNITDVDGIVEKCKEVGVDGVLNFCIDPAQWPYLEVCERLGLPCYATREQLEILTDKVKFKDYCVAHNVDVIPEYSIKDIISDKAEYPLFIKPSINRGSRGQYICYSKNEALEAYPKSAAESADGKAICEKYMVGKQDLGTAFYVINGEPYLVKFGDRFLGKEEDGLNKQVMCTRLPSPFAPIFEAKVSDRVKTMIKSMGIKFGPVFLQGFIDGDTVRYYDPARRMPGGDYDLILKKATGFDTVKTLIHFALTGDNTVCYGEPKNSYLLNGGMGLLFTISVRPGKISKVEGLDKMLKHPNVVYGRQIIQQKTVIPASGDIKQRVAAIGAFIPQGMSPKKFVEEVYATYHVYDENGEDMIVSRVDGNLL